MPTMETKNWTLLLLLLICKWTESVLGPGMLTLSPMTVAPVCRVGDPLSLTCTASIDFIIWSVSRVNEQGMLEKAINDEPINSEDLLQMLQPIVTSLATFTFTRTSAQGELPLISTLSIDSVSISLNGTVVRCIDGRSQEENNLMTGSTTCTIQIIDTRQSIQLISELNVLEPYYDASNVTVTVEWAQLEPGVVYSVEVLPSVPTGYFTDTTRYRLTIPYKEMYNFSIMASTPCRPNSAAFKSITLNYAKCDHPRDLLTACAAESNVSVSMIEGHSGFPIEGTTITFSCPSGLKLIGPRSAKCTENGEWEPDLMEIRCHHSEIEALGPTCTESALAAAVLSTVIVTSILMFFGGFISGLYVDRKFCRDSSKGTSHVTAERPHQVPVYDYPDAANQHEQNLELKENVAYLPSKPTAVKVNK